MDFDLVLEGLTFQNGRGGEGNSGAIRMMGHGPAEARFENCKFLRNLPPDGNGGAMCHHYGGSEPITTRRIPPTTDAGAGQLLIY
jgi:hypothetical protein